MKTLIALAVSLAIVSPASAATPTCAPFADALRMIMDNYGEAPAFIAISGPAVIMITVNAKTGTFTLWSQRTPDVLCAVAGGEGWQAAPDSIKAVAPPGKPS